VLDPTTRVVWAIPSLKLVHRIQPNFARWQIQDGATCRYLKKSKNDHISVWTIGMKLGMVIGDAYWPSELYRQLKFRIQSSLSRLLVLLLLYEIQVRLLERLEVWFSLFVFGQVHILVRPTICRSEGNKIASFKAANRIYTKFDGHKGVKLTQWSSWVVHVHLEWRKCRYDKYTQNLITRERLGIFEPNLLARPTTSFYSIFDFMFSPYFSFMGRALD